MINGQKAEINVIVPFTLNGFLVQGETTFKINSAVIGQKVIMEISTTTGMPTYCSDFKEIPIVTRMQLLQQIPMLLVYVPDFTQS